MEYSWETVKNATNTLFKRLCNPDIDDFVGGICNDMLPKAMDIVLVQCMVQQVYPDVDQDVATVINGYKQLESRGAIYGKD